MAEKDIKDLENVTALANTDELLAIVAGLGKKLNWAKMKEQLTMELPIATNNSNGLMSASDKNSSFVKGKVDVNSFLKNGVYTITDTDINNPSKVWSTLIVFDALDYAVHLLISHDASSVYVRTRYTVSGILNTWKKLH